MSDPIKELNRILKDLRNRLDALGITSESHSELVAWKKKWITHLFCDQVIDPLETQYLDDDELYKRTKYYIKQKIGDTVADLTEVNEVESVTPSGYKTLRGKVYILGESNDEANRFN